MTLDNDHLGNRFWSHGRSGGAPFSYLPRDSATWVNALCSTCTELAAPYVDVALTVINYVHKSSYYTTEGNYVSNISECASSHRLLDQSSSLPQISLSLHIIWIILSRATTKISGTMLVQTWTIQVLFLVHTAEIILSLLGFFSVQVLENALHVWGLR